MRTGSFPAFAFPVVSASLKITPGKPNTPYTFPFWIVMLSFGYCVPKRDFWGCQHPSPLFRPPQAAASSWCPSLSALSCCLQDLPPAAVSMDAFPHQTRADSGCGAFSCLQAVLENSLALSSEITWGVTIPSLGTTMLSAKTWVSHPDSPVSHSPVGTQECLHGGLEYPWCPQCAVSVRENRAGVQLPVG